MRSREGSRVVAWLGGLLLPGALILAFCGCSGNAQRSRLLSSLRVELDSNPTRLEAGQRFPLKWRIHNSGPSAVHLCIQSQTLGLRSSQGGPTPLVLATTFDGCEAVRLDPNESRELAASALVFPSVPAGPATIFARLRVWIVLGQWYWPGTLFSLAADWDVDVTRGTSPCDVPPEGTCLWYV
jgi:hypothetical protein